MNDSSELIGLHVKRNDQWYRVIGPEKNIDRMMKLVSVPSPEPQDASVSGLVWDEKPVIVAMYIQDIQRNGVHFEEMKKAA